MLAEQPPSPQIKQLLLDCFDETKADQASEFLLAVATDLPHEFTDSAVAALVTIFREPLAASRVMEAFLALDPPISFLRAAAKEARLLLPEEWCDAAAGIIGAAIDKSALAPSARIVNDILNSLEPLVPPVWPLDNWSRPHSAAALRSCAALKPDLTHEAVSAALASAEADRRVAAAAGVVTLCASSAVPPDILTRWAELVLRALSELPIGRPRWEDTQADGLLIALGRLAAGGPPVIVGTVLERLKSWDEQRSDRLADAFRHLQPEKRDGSGWFPAVAADLGDPGLRAATRWSLADAVLMSVDRRPQSIGTFFDDALESLIRVCNEISDSALGRDVETAAAHNDPILLSTVVARVRSLARAAASSSPDSAFARAEERFDTAGGELAQSEVATLAGEVASLDRALLPDFVPFVARLLAGSPLLQLGAVEGCYHLAEVNPDLLPPDLLEMVLAVLTSSTLPQIFYSTAGILEVVTVADPQLAVQAFNHFTGVAARWSVQEPGYGYFDRAIRGLLGLARQHPDLRGQLAGLLSGLAGSVECLTGAVCSSLRVLAALGAWYPELGPTSIQAILKVTAVHPIEVTLDADRKNESDSIAWVFQYTPETVSDSAPAFVTWAERRSQREQRIVLGLLTSFGCYGPAGSPFASDAGGRQVIWDDAFRLLLNAEIKAAANDGEGLQRRLAEAEAATGRWDAERHLIPPGQVTPMHPDDVRDQEWLLRQEARKGAWLLPWIRLRQEWTRCFESDEVGTGSIRDLQKQFDSMGRFGPDRLDRECAHLVRSLLFAAEAVAEWFQTLLQGGPADRRDLRQAAIAKVGQCTRLANSLSGSRLPEAYAACYQALRDEMVAADAASGPDEVFKRFATVPLPVPRTGLLVVSRWSDSVMRRERRPWSPPKEPKPTLASIRASVGGIPLSAPVELVAGELNDIDIQIAFKAPQQDVVVQVVSTLAKDEYTANLTLEQSGESPQRNVRFGGHLCFLRPQAPGAKPHILNLVVSVRGADEQRKEVHLVGPQSLPFRVTASRGALGQPGLGAAQTVPSGRPVHSETLSTDAEHRYLSQGFQSRLRILIKGPNRTRMIISIGMREVSLTLAEFRLFLRLVVAVHESEDAYVPLGDDGAAGLASEEWFMNGNPNAPDGTGQGAEKAANNLRNRIRDAVLPLKHTDFIEISKIGRRLVRLSTDRECIECNREALRQHADRYVMELAERLPAPCGPAPP